MSAKREKLIASIQKLLEKGSFAKAAKELRRLLDEDGGDPKLWQKLGEAEEQAGHRDAAIEAYGKAAELSAERGSFLQAEAVYRNKLLPLAPELLSVHLHLAELYQHMGLPGRAMEEYLTVSGFYEQHGRAAESKDILRRVLLLMPDHLAARLRLAELHTADRELDRAAEELSVACRQLREAGRDEDYLKVAERLAFLRPDDLPHARELIRLLLERGSAHRALHHLQRVLQIVRDDAESHELLAQVFDALDQASKAVQVLHELARIHDRRGAIAQRNEVYQTILRRVPGDAEARAALGTSNPDLAPAPPMAASPPPSPSSVSPLPAVPVPGRMVGPGSGAGPGSPAGSGSGAGWGSAGGAGGGGGWGSAGGLVAPPPLPGAAGQRTATVTAGPGSSGGAAGGGGGADAGRSTAAGGQAGGGAGPGATVGGAGLGAAGAAGAGGGAGARSRTDAPRFTPLPVSPGSREEEILRLLTETKVYIKYGLKQKALEHIARILVQDPTNLEALVFRKDVLLSEGDHEAAALVLLRLAELTRDAPATSARYQAEARGLGVGLSRGHEPRGGWEAQGAGGEAGAGVGSAAGGGVGTGPGLDGPPRSAVFRAAGRGRANAGSTPLPGSMGGSGGLAGGAGGAQAGAPGTLGGHPGGAGSGAGALPRLEQPQRAPLPPLRTAAPPAARQEERTRTAVAGPPGGARPAASGPHWPVAGSSDQPDRNETITPRSETVTPRNEAAAQRNEALAPPRREALAPRSEAGTAGGVGARSEMVTPRSEMVTPRSEMVTPRSEAAGAPASVGAGQRRETPPPQKIAEALREADFFLEQGLPGDAQQQLQDALRLDPGHAGLRQKLQQVERRLADEAAAAAAQAEARARVTAPPPSTPAQRARTEPEHAIDSLPLEAGQAPPQDSEDGETHYDLGIAYLEMGLTQDAIQEFLTAMEADVKRAECHRLIGQCHRQAGNPKESISWFKRGLRVQGITQDETLGLLFSLGDAYLAMNEPAEARRFLDKVASVEPAYPNVQNLLRLAGSGGARGVPAGR